MAENWGNSTAYQRPSNFRRRPESGKLRGPGESSVHWLFPATLILFGKCYQYRLRPDSIMLSFTRHANETTHAKEKEMDSKTKTMVQEWIAKDGGDKEKTAKWMARTLKIAGIKECRSLVELATK